jgi:hypothetical protein
MVPSSVGRMPPIPELWNLISTTDSHCPMVVGRP